MWGLLVPRRCSRSMVSPAGTLSYVQPIPLSRPRQVRGKGVWPSNSSSPGLSGESAGSEKDPGWLYFYVPLLLKTSRLVLEKLQTNLCLVSHRISANSIRTFCTPLRITVSVLPLRLLLGGSDNMEYVKLPCEYKPYYKWLSYWCGSDKYYKPLISLLLERLIAGNILLSFLCYHKK